MGQEDIYKVNGVVPGYAVHFTAEEVKVSCECPPLMMSSALKPPIHEYYKVCTASVAIIFEDGFL